MWPFPSEIPLIKSDAARSTGASKVIERADKTRTALLHSASLAIAAAASMLCVGATVEARWGGGDKGYLGTITAVHADGTFQVRTRRTAISRTRSWRS